MPLALLIIFIQLHHPFTPYFLPTILSPLVSVRLSDRAHPTPFLSISSSFHFSISLKLV